MNKRSSPKIEKLLSPKSMMAKKSPKTIQRSDADHSQIIVGDADADHSQIILGVAVKLLGGIYPPIPPCFGTPVCMQVTCTSMHVYLVQCMYSIYCTSIHVYIQFDAYIQFNACIFNSMHLFNAMHVQCMYIQVNACIFNHSTGFSTASNFRIRIFPRTVIKCHCH